MKRLFCALLGLCEATSCRCAQLPITLRSPFRVAATVKIDLPRPRTEEMELTPPFLEHVRELRFHLRQRVAA